MIANIHRFRQYGNTLETLNQKLVVEEGVEAFLWLGVVIIAKETFRGFVDVARFCGAFAGEFEVFAEIDRCAVSDEIRIGNFAVIGFAGMVMDTVPTAV